jgi:hypothetical protein
MEMAQENSLYSYIKQTKIAIFCFIKSENRRAKQVLSEGLVQWERKGCEERV